MCQPPQFPPANRIRFKQARKYLILESTAPGTYAIGSVSVYQPDGTHGCKRPAQQTRFQGFWNTGRELGGDLGRKVYHVGNIRHCSVTVDSSSFGSKQHKRTLVQIGRGTVQWYTVAPISTSVADFDRANTPITPHHPRNEPTPTRRRMHQGARRRRQVLKTRKRDVEKGRKDATCRVGWCCCHSHYSSHAGRVHDSFFVMRTYVLACS